MKTCTKCKVPKRVEEFYRRKEGKDGRQAQCKRCVSLRKEFWTDRSEYQKRWAKDNPLRVLINQTRYRAKKLGIPFNLAKEDIIIPKVCPILGVTLVRGSGPNSPSLDRIIPEKGYVKGNVWVISNKANSMKQNATPAELLKFAEWAKDYYAK